MESTTVAIIGAGPAGLTLANLLRRNGVDCVVLELRSRAYVENRQRAGILDNHAGRIFAESGLAGQVLAGAPVETKLEIRYAGEPRFLDVPALAGGRPSHLVPQQLLVRRLIAALPENVVRFEALDIALHDLDTPLVTYRDTDGVSHELRCAYVAGCDGFHGISRTDSGLHTYSDICLQRTWNYQEFSRWYTEMVHDITAGPFQRKLAQARLDRLFTSPPAAAAFADLMAGTLT
jgi:p-hydroxybenzoate 3-monooxygenase